MKRRPLDGCKVVVTGAAGNLGQALVKGLLEKGCQLLAIDVNQEALQSLRPLASDRQLRFLRMNLTSASRAAAWKKVVQFQPDGVILNAGITRIAPFMETEESDFRKVFEVNFFSSVGALQALLPDLIEKRGFVAAISSVSGFAPLKLRSAYSPSKHAISAFIDTLRSETPEVDFLIAYPSFLTTEVKSSSYQTARKSRGSVTPEKVARRIVQGIEKRKPRLMIPLQARVARILWAVWPWLYMQMMIKRA
ncbi:MAG: hypothetical protein CMN77_04265 [Spirochaetaceae bacterium]|nr:hypothetical protein [Spirochaetaceae bacterium]|tara:strand:+ start:6084 stop:6833 length:750 start_codon:yes stop_codon:yes gene_type:complete